MALFKDNSLLSKIRRPALSDRHLIWLPQQRLGYFRVPKAANSSIRFQLAKTFELTNKNGLRPNKDRFWKELDKTQGANLTTSEFMQRDDTQGAWLFSFVRNPVTRLYSCWNNKIIENKDLSRAFKKMDIELGMDFPDFVQKVYDAPDEKADIHVRSQYSILTHDSQLVPHFIGRVERVKADWAHVRLETRARGVDLGPLPHVNVRQDESTNPTDTVAHPVLKMICERYEQDFRMFYPDVFDNIMKR